MASAPTTAATAKSRRGSTRSARPRIALAKQPMTKPAWTPLVSAACANLDNPYSAASAGTNYPVGGTAWSYSAISVTEPRFESAQGDRMRLPFFSKEPAKKLLRKYAPDQDRHTAATGLLERSCGSAVIQGCHNDSPGNRLEKLGRDRRGQHSIRINDQWRICFRWRDDGPWDVEIVDYH